MAEEKEKPLDRKDVLRLIKENDGTAEGLDLSGKIFEEGINLSKIHLDGVILTEAILFKSNLREASLYGADFRDAVLSQSNLTRADLCDANLQNALLAGANLEKANLSGADLSGTNLRAAKLQGAALASAGISQKTNLEGAEWGNYVLDEEWIDYIVLDEEKGQTLSDIFAAAASVYRRLKIWHTNAGMCDIAGEFFYREMEARRKAQSWKSEPHLKLWSWVMRLLCGYGERLKRVPLWMVISLILFALVYYFAGKLGPLDSLYFSAVSFTALGYGRWAPEPIGWVKGLGAFEAFVGVFMMALFLVTFVRKMTR